MPRTAKSRHERKKSARHVVCLLKSLLRVLVGVRERDDLQRELLREPVRGVRRDGTSMRPSLERLTVRVASRIPRRVARLPPLLENLLVVLLFPAPET